MCHFVRIENKIKITVHEHTFEVAESHLKPIWRGFEFSKLAKVFDSRLRTFTLSICSKDHNELFFGSIDLCVVRIKRLTKKIYEIYTAC